MSWPKGRLHPMTEETKAKIRIARAKQIITFETRQKQSIASKRLGIKPPTFYGDKHPNWLGDKVLKGALHGWVVRRLGKPNRCEFCKSMVAKRFNWANKSHEYKRDLSDWIRLCSKCHVNYDRQYYVGSYEKGWQTRRKRLSELTQ